MEENYPKQQNKKVSAFQHIYEILFENENNNTTRRIVRHNRFPLQSGFTIPRVRQDITKLIVRASYLHGEKSQTILHHVF